MTEFHKMPGHLVRRLNQIATALFREHMHARDLDLTPVQFAALSALSDAPGMDQATLAATIAYDKVTLGGVVDRLASKGLIARAPSLTDRRAKTLSLTQKGTQTLKSVTPTVAALQSDILHGLDPDEADQLVALLAKLTLAHDAKAD